MRAANGDEALIHMGIDTVDLKGEGFKIHVEENQNVSTDTLLAEVDLNLLKKQHKDTSVIVVFPDKKDSNLNISYGTKRSGMELGSI